MKNRKLLRDSFYVNNEDLYGVIINNLSEDLYFHYEKNSQLFKLSIKDSNGNVVNSKGIVYPELESGDDTVNSYVENDYVGDYFE